MPFVSARNLGFSFEQQTVFDGLELEIEPGDFVAILGASGCGKSTLLRLLGGLLAPTYGEITADGRPIETQNSNLSFVFQQPTLCPWRTVQSNIELPLQLRSVPPNERRQLARDAIQMVNLKPLDETKLPSQLSGGMQMRASIARALVTKPSIMLMDEPFSALDEVLRQQLCETCLELWQREKWTTVFVTHNVTEAVFMSRRIYILAGSPSRFVETIPVPFEQRDAELRTSPEFIQFVSGVSKKLRRAVEQADER